MYISVTDSVEKTKAVKVKNKIANEESEFTERRNFCFSFIHRQTQNFVHRDFFFSKRVHHPSA